MVGSGIIKKVTSAKWATPIVTPMKMNGQPRICGDFKITVNPISRQCASTTLEPEDLFMKLNGYSRFSKIDLENAFLQVPLNADSQELTTINTPWGLYSYMYLPFGLTISSGVFQQVINSILEGVKNVQAYQNDIIVFTKDEQSHEETVERVLNRLIEFNVKINKSKCIFNTDKISYLGYIVSSEGIEPDTSKFNPLMLCPDPTNVKELQSLLGSLQYYSRFVKGFAELTSPLYDLCK